MRLFRRKKDAGCISFPKSGRTWLRVMLDELGVHLDYTHAGAGHNDARHFKAMDTSAANRFRKIVFLHRDPRDTVVSGYHQATKRIGVFHGPIGEFLRDPHHGIEKVARFNMMWLDFARANPSVLVVAYEAMIADARREVAAIAAFLGAPAPESAVADAVLRNRFDEMQRKEVSGDLQERYGKILSPADPDDPNSYKVRRGMVGGFVDELDPDDIAYCDEVLTALAYPARMNVHDPRNAWPVGC